MDTSKFIIELKKSNTYFIQFNGEADVSEGFKLSIQGKDLNDSAFLYESLRNLLLSTKCSFKFATEKLLTSGIDQQQNKVLTIYIPNGVDAKSFSELVYLNINDYKGGRDVKRPDSYEHYANAIYFRKDRDENGMYIDPRKNKQTPSEARAL